KMYWSWQVVLLLCVQSLRRGRTHALRQEADDQSNHESWQHDFEVVMVPRGLHQGDQPRKKQAQNSANHNAPGSGLYFARKPTAEYADDHSLDARPDQDADDCRP